MRFFSSVFRSIMNRSNTLNQPNQYEGGGTKTVSMFSKLVSQGSSFVMEGVKNLVVKRHVSNFIIVLEMNDVNVNFNFDTEFTGDQNH